MLFLSSRIVAQTPDDIDALLVTDIDIDVIRAMREEWRSTTSDDRWPSTRTPLPSHGAPAGLGPGVCDYRRRAAANPASAMPRVTSVPGAGTSIGGVIANPVVIEKLDALVCRSAKKTSRLYSTPGRIGRKRWIDQARYLAAGDLAGFEREFVKPR